MAGYKTNLEALRDHLQADETIVASCFGRYSSTAHEGARTGLLAVTPKRVIFFTLTRFGHEHEMESIDLPRVVSVDTAQGLLGPYVDLRTPDAAVMLKWIQAGSPEAFVRFIRVQADPTQRVDAAEAPATKAPTATAPTGCVALVLLGALGWWMLDRDDGPAGSAAPAYVPDYQTAEAPTYAAPAYLPSPAQLPPVEPPSPRELRAALRALVADGRRLPRGNDWDCGERMRRLIEQADGLQAQADALPPTGDHVRGPDGRPIDERLALGAAAGHVRQCVTCSPSAVEQCDMASGYLRR